jgi:Ca2+/H+ antiporter, TMEM165/GDT1 family
MSDWTSAGPSVLASFMASLVECVEALTVVLAVGAVRGWRSALTGTAAALVVLAGLCIVLGQSLARVPLSWLQVVVGTLLLLFGMRWLRKAILRAAGILELHDEARAFAAEMAALCGMPAARRQGLDGIAVAASFKIVMLEGIEVVFIVIAIGVGNGLLVPAAAGALLALFVVAGLGVWLHRPLAAVPENTLKFVVGVMLTAFGAFWVGEGIGLAWPGREWAIVVLIAAYATAAWALVSLCRRVRGTGNAAARPGREGAPQGMSAVIVHELWGLFVDDGWLAGGVILWTFAMAAAMHLQDSTRGAAGPIFALGLALMLATSATRRARQAA